MKNILTTRLTILFFFLKSATAFAQESSGSLWEVNPFVYLNAVVGNTDLEDSGLARGGHDPAGSGFSIPSLAIGLDAYYGDYLGFFTEGVFFWNEEDGWDAELEELYIKANQLPYGFDLQAGRFLVSTGAQNNVHDHEWGFVDNQLGDVRFLGEDGLSVDGVEVAWRPRGRLDDQVIASYGRAVSHEEEEGEDEEEGHNEEAEDSLWDENVLTLRYRVHFQSNYNHSLRTGISYVQGQNFFNETARLYSADTHYTWMNDDGDLELKFTWTNELLFRDVDTEEGSFDEWAFSSRASYSWNPIWVAALRFDYLEGVDDPELAERFRVSPALSREFEYKENPLIMRIQYNYDHSEIESESRNDHSIWLQLNYQWGSGSQLHKH